MKKKNDLRLEPLDGHDHIESLSKKGKSTYFMWGRNGRFAHFIEKHRISIIIVANMVVTNRDEDSISKIRRRINDLFENISYRAGEWINNEIKDSNVHGRKEIFQKKRHE